MINIAVALFILITLSFCLSSVSFALEMWMGQGHILHGYGQWLERNKRYGITKPLGLCIYCQNVWVQLIGFNLLIFFVPELRSYWYIMGLCIFLGQAWLRVVLK